MKVALGHVGRRTGAPADCTAEVAARWEAASGRVGEAGAGAVRSRWRDALAFVAWAALGLCVGLAAALTLPTAAGYRSLVVLSGSMAPAVSAGDVVIGRGVAPRDARVGDVVTFRDPGGRERLLTHRVHRAQAAGGGRFDFVTKGDANAAEETWSVPADARLGKVVARVPKVGYVLGRASTPLARVVLVVAPLALLALLEVLAVRRLPAEAKGTGAPRPA